MKNTKDLLEDFDAIPKGIQKILFKYEKKIEKGEDGYKVCRQMEEELKPLGYTFDWGLDAQPHNLRRIDPGK